MASNVDDLSVTEQRLCEALAAYFDANHAGETLDRASWLARYPDLAPQLTEFLDEQDRLLRLTGPLRADAEGRDDALAPHIEPPPESRNGDPHHLGDFELIEEIARGGMGIVYRARQRSLNRLVALKILRHDVLADPDDVRRFRLEAEAVAQLDHPNIVPVYGVGEQFGLSFIAMKLIEGDSLARCVRENSLDTRAAARIVSTVARAVHHVHERGILHRDLKPSNIVFDAENEPHITDFGLAKRVESDSDLTRSGAILGTPSYMAPEQASGKGAALTAATDVYGLGAVLYSLLTGRPPFDGDSALDTLERVRNAEPEPPTVLGRPVHRDLQTICLKCLEKEPQRRYGSALALAEDLERWLRGESTLARARPWWGRLGRWARRRRRALAASITIVLMVGLMLTGIEWRVAIVTDREQARRQREEMDHFQHATRRARYAREIRQAASRLANGDIRGARDLLEAHRGAAGAADLRGFEWFYLHSLTAPGPSGMTRNSRHVLVGHEGRDVYHVEYARHGGIFATAGADGTARVWDATSRAQRLVLRGHTGDVNWVSFDPGARRLVTGGADGTVRLWDAGDGRMTALLGDVGREIVATLFTLDGGDVIACTREAFMYRWDAQSGRRVAETRQVHHINKMDVESMAITNNGRQLALCVRMTNASAVDVFDLHDRKLTYTSTINLTGAARSLAPAPDGRSLAVGTRSGDEPVRILDTTNRAPLRALKGPGSVEALAYSPDGRTLAIGGNFLVLSPSDGTGQDRRPFLQGHTARVWCVAYSPDGCTLASTSRDGTIRLWDAAELAVPGRTVFRGPASWRSDASSVAFSRDGAHVLGCNGMEGVISGNLRDGTTRTIRAPKSSATRDQVRLSPDGNWLSIRELCGEIDPNTPADTLHCRVILEDLVGGRAPVRVSPPAFQNVIVPYWSPDAHRIALLDRLGVLTLWDASTGRQVGRTLAFASATSAPRFLPRGEGLFAFGSSGAEGTVDFVTWDSVRASTDRRPIPIADPSTFGADFVMAPDGQWIASFGPDVALWRLPNLDVHHRLVGHRDRVSSAVFAPDSRTLATVGVDATVRLWNVATGQALVVLEEHSGPVGAVAFSPNGRLLAACATVPDGGIEVIVWGKD